MGAQFAIFWGVLRDPRVGFGRVIDEGSLLFALAAAGLVSAPYLVAGRGLLFGFLFVLCAGYVPGLILGAVAVGRSGAFGSVFRKDYGAALACTLIGYSIAQAPSLILPVPWIAATLLLALTTCAARTLWGLSYARAFGVSAFGMLGAAGAAWLYPLLGGRSLVMVLVLLALLFSEDLTSSFRERGAIRRHLESAASNPHDGDAQYQLGLLYEQRRNVPEALSRFGKAVRIDPDLAEAHYGLGRIALAQNRADDALAHLARAAALDDKLSGSEVWRAIGAAHLAAGRAGQAEQALQKFVARREHDPEGLYLLGEALERLGKPGSRELYTRCVEAVDTGASYRRRELSAWKQKARAKL